MNNKQIRENVLNNWRVHGFTTQAITDALNIKDTEVIKLNKKFDTSCEGNRNFRKKLMKMVK